MACYLGVDRWGAVMFVATLTVWQHVGNQRLTRVRVASSCSVISYVGSSATVSILSIAKDPVQCGMFFYLHVWHQLGMAISLCVRMPAKVCAQRSADLSRQW